MYFQITNDNSQGYRIGGRMFPVKDKETMEIFNWGCTNPITNPKIKYIVDLFANTFEDQNPYASTATIVEEAKRFEIDLKFYSGWIFPNQFNAFPFHHAWAVYEGDIIDVVMRKTVVELITKIDRKNPEWIKENTAKLRKEYRQSRKKLSDVCTFGQVLSSNILYIGCEDSPENAVATINKLVSEYPNHPTYSGKIVQHKVNSNIDIFTKK